MKTKVRKLEANVDHASVIAEAARCLADGGLVVFPTETVYGLGVNAADPSALKRLREVKKRDEGKPFTVHIGSRSAVSRFVPKLSGLGQRLTSKAWPGPLTIVFHVDDVLATPVIRDTAPEHAASLYHEGTVGIRCPDNPAALALLSAAGVPVVAASANPATKPAPVDADEALATLDGKVDLVLDAGRTRYAKPSTIVEVTDSTYRVLREGVLDERVIRRMTQVLFLVVCSGNTCRSPMAAGLLRKLLAEKVGVAEKDLAARGYMVESAGTSAMNGASPSSAAVRVLAARGMDIAAHKSQPLTPDLASRADYVYAMTDSHVQSIGRIAPAARDRVRKLADENIEDPIGEGDEVYAQCARQIEQALKRRLEEVVL
jgi:L-threonylcarbamoyladenylate synthase